MSKRKIENQIKTEMREHTPNVLNRIDFHEAINTSLDQVKAPWYKRLSMPKMATAFVSVLVIALVVLVSLDDQGPVPPDDTKQPITMSVREEIYSLSAMQGAVFFHQLTQENNIMNISVHALSHQRLDTSSYLIHDYLPIFNSYVNMLEPIMAGIDTYQFDIELSPLEAYDYQVRFSSMALSGETYVYELHYNEHQVDDDEYLMEGIMIIDGVTYVLHGEITIDDDEFELELIAHLPHNEDTYLELNITRELDEQSFEYEYVRNGDTLFESSMTIEYDDDEIVAEIEYQDALSEIELTITRKYGSQRLWLEYEIEEHDVDEEGEIRIDVVYDQSTNVYYYAYTITIEDHTFTVRKTRYLQTNQTVQSTL